MSGDLTLNKILGAALATGLVIMGVRIGADAIYHRDAPEKPGYLVEVAEVEEAGGAAVEVLPDWGTVLATADIAAGEKVFAKCVSCHSISQGGANMTGPNLYGVVGRAMGSHGGMTYSDAMMEHATEMKNWTYDELYGFLGAPAKWVKGTKMSFAGVKKVDERVNLIAYMKAQGSAGYAVPAPDPTRQPGAAAATAPATEGAVAEGAPAADAAATPAAAPAPVPAE